MKPSSRKYSYLLESTEEPALDDEQQVIRQVQLDAGIAEPFSSWDFYAGRTLASEAIPVFLSLLSDKRLAEQGHYREGIARSLGVAEAYPYFDQLIELYKAEPACDREPSDLGVKGGLAAAICTHALRHKTERFDDIYALSCDEKNGLSRLDFFESFLRKSKDSRAHEPIRSVILNSPNKRWRWRLTKSAIWKKYWQTHSLPSPILDSKEQP